MNPSLTIYNLILTYLTITFANQEKADLLRRLSEMGDERERQRQRQKEMLRLKREQRQLREEGEWEGAAMVLGLGHENDRR